MYGCIRLDTGGILMISYIIGIGIGLAIAYMVYSVANINIGNFRLDDEDDIA